MKQPNEELTFAVMLGAWAAGLNAVDAGRLVEQAVSVSGQVLRVGEREFQLDEVERIRVVGAGKAARAMAEGLHRAVGVDVQLDKRVSGWINVPASDGVSAWSLPSGMPTIWPFAARPAGVNLPTEDCYGGTLLMEDIVKRTGKNELCVALISGGGSALLCHPPRGVLLSDLVKLTRWLSAAGASIQQLNTVRKQTSLVKGGRLAARFAGKHMASLILSDVLGDQVDLIASGPTVQDHSTPSDALEVIASFDPKFRNTPRRIVSHLRRSGSAPVIVPGNTSNHLIGNVRTAVDRTVDVLIESGFDCESEIQCDPLETAADAGRRMAQWIFHRKGTARPLALVSGGEPVVVLGKSPGRGGRNQHLVLAALAELLGSDLGDDVSFGLLSGGTDGEDGNTKCAGAAIDSRTVRDCRTGRLDPCSFLKRFDSHAFFAGITAGSLLRVPASVQTNVCDLRIVLVSPKRN